MKKLLIISCLVFPIAVSAQKVNKAKGKPPVQKKASFADQVKKSPTTEFTRPPGTYEMRPDNMPCVVPDMAKVENIPNSITPNTKIPDMPNGLKPRRDSTEQKWVP